MNYIKFFITLILSLTVALSYAQNSTLKVSESAEYKDEEKARDIVTIHTTKNGLTGIVRESKRDLLFDVFDKNLIKIHSLVAESSKKETYIGDIVFEDEMKVFTVFSPKVKERIVYCHIFNLKNWNAS
jgi:hypothetical protein